MTGKTWTTASGKTLTETDAAQLADEFERDDTLNDVSITFSRKEGRRSLSGPA